MEKRTEALKKCVCGEGKIKGREEVNQTENKEEVTFKNGLDVGASVLWGGGWLTSIKENGIWDGLLGGELSDRR